MTYGFLCVLIVIGDFSAIFPLQPALKNALVIFIIERYLKNEYENQKAVLASALKFGNNRVTTEAFMLIELCYSILLRGFVLQSNSIVGSVL